MKNGLLRPGAFLVLVGLAVLGLFIYANAIPHPFVHDDVVFIKLNPNIARWDNIGEAFGKPGVPFQSLRITTPYYRPVLEMLYRLQYAVFGMNPSGFHLFNIFLHVINSWLVFLAVRFWGVRRLWAAVIALFFLAHPVQSEAVACVSGISNLAVACGLLLSFVLYAQGRIVKGSRRGICFCGAALVFVVALFTKEQAVLLPGFLLLYELGRLRRNKLAGVAGRLFLFFSLAAVYFLIRGRLFPDHWQVALANLPELWLRVLAIPRTLLMYLGLVVWPTGLHYYRSVDILVPPGWSWGGLATLAMACGYALVRMPRRWRKPTLAGLGWGFLFLAPALNIVPLINEYSWILTAEHFIYISLAGFLVAGFGLLGWGISQWNMFRSAWACEGYRRIIIAGVLFVAVVWGGQTIWQNTFWRGEVPLFERTLRFEPGLGRVHLLLARAYATENRFAEAMSEYAHGLNIMRDYVKKSRNPEARRAYQQFIKGIYRDRGQIYLALGDIGRSAEEFRASLAIRLDGMEIKDTGIDDSQTANNLALNLLRMGQRDAAKGWWQAAVSLNPHNAEALNNLGMLALERKDKQTALFYFLRSLRAAPGFVQAEQNWIRARRL